MLTRKTSCSQIGNAKVGLFEIPDFSKQRILLM